MRVVLRWEHGDERGVEYPKAQGRAGPAFKTRGSCGTGPTIPAIPVKAEEQVDFAPTTVDKSPKPST